MLVSGGPTSPRASLIPGIVWHVTHPYADSASAPRSGSPPVIAAAVLYTSRWLQAPAPIASVETKSTTSGDRARDTRSDDDAPASDSRSHAANSHRPTAV